MGIAGDGEGLLHFAFGNYGVVEAEFLAAIGIAHAEDGVSRPGRNAVAAVEMTGHLLMHMLHVGVDLRTDLLQQ